MLSIQDLSKSFGALKALQEVSFKVERDQVHGKKKLVKEIRP